MICKNCEKELPEGSVLCCFCGAPVEETVVAEVTEDVIPAQPKNKPKWWAITLAALAGLVLVIAMVAAVLYGMGKDPIEMLKPKGNTIAAKETYTVEDNEARKNKETVVATIADHELTNGELQIYYWETVYNFLNDNYYYLSMYGLDLATPLDEQMYPLEDGKTWQQFFLETALGTWQRYTTLQVMAEADGFQVDSEMQEFLDGLAETAEANAAAYGFASAQEWLEGDCGPGVSQEGYYNYITSYYVGTAYLATRYEEMNPTAEDVEAYFVENETTFATAGVTKESGNYYDVRHILIGIEGGTKDENGNMVYTEEEWEACRQKAQEILDQWAAGEATEDSFAELAVKHSVDGGSASNGGLYTDLTEQTNFVEEFKNWYLDENNTAGSTGLVKSVYGYHIMYQCEVRPIWFDTAQSELLADRVSDLIDEGMQEYAMKVDYKKIVLGNQELS